MSADEELRWLWLTTLAALHLWDDERWDLLSGRYVELARKTGALSELPLALSTRSMMLLFAGDVTTATALTDEGRAVIDATGSQFAPYAAMGLAALRGRQVEVSALIEDTASDVALRGEGIAMSVAEWTNALLHNGLGRYPEAMRAAQQALHRPRHVRGHGDGGVRRASQARAAGHRRDRPQAADGCFPAGREDEDEPIELDENTQRLYPGHRVRPHRHRRHARMAVSRPFCSPERMRPAGSSAVPAPFQRCS